MVQTWRGDRTLNISNVLLTEVYIGKIINSEKISGKHMLWVLNFFNDGKTYCCWKLHLYGPSAIFIIGHFTVQTIICKQHNWKCFSGNFDQKAKSKLAAIGIKFQNMRRKDLVNLQLWISARLLLHQTFNINLKFSRASS